MKEAEVPISPQKDENSSPDEAGMIITMTVSTCHTVAVSAYGEGRGGIGEGGGGEGDGEGEKRYSILK
jgi:hypothetical protein